MSSKLSAAQLEQLRELLIQQQRELSSLLDSAQTDTRPVALDQQSVGRVSRIDAIQQQQMAVASQQQAAALLRLGELALRRIDSGDYGECQDCGEPIAFARLQARPSTCLCIGCQAARESTS
jgi:DnaK suppressor protein